MGAAKVNSSTAGGAVGVNCGAARRQQGVGLAAGRSSKISVNCGQSINGYDEVYDIRMNECIV